MPNATCPSTLRWHGQPTRCDTAEVLSRLAPLTAQYDLSTGARRARSATYLDTVDRRLRKQGLVLTHQRASGPGALVLTEASTGTEATTDAGTELTATLAETPEWPARIEHLPPGPVRDKAAAAMWIRAVLPIARSRTLSREVAVRNEDGKTVVRLDWVEATGAEPVKTEPLVQLVIRPVLGYQRDADRVRSALLATDGFEATTVSAHEEFLQAAGAGAEPNEPRRPAITREMPADVAIATALLGFADAIAANVSGTIDDVDTEFLHDLRVAVRRTRSLLKLAGDVLPVSPARLARYADAFKWVGDFTTPTRDLDVYLLELDQLASRLTVGVPEDLEPFGAYVQRQRERERRKLVRALKSQRFERLLDGWTALLTQIAEAEQTPGEEGAEAQPATAEQLAAERIRTVVKRVVRRARVVTPDSPSEEIHALRKRCKELRYLLEVFRPVCDPQAHQAVVKELKQLQDVLGSFQDGEVQSEGLREFAEQMLENDRPPAATLLAMGELSGRFGDQQKQARAALTERVGRFTRPKTRRRIEALLS